MAKYIDIPEAEMIGFLVDQGFSAIGVSGTVERVYGQSRVIARGDARIPLTIRVYTTFVAGGQRMKGEDAIRVSLWMRVPDAKMEREVPIMVKGFKRVHRVAGWQKNLLARIMEARLYKFAACEKCGRLMVEKVNRKTDTSFLGCLGYPDCKYTRAIPTAD